jgi:hypothetical protein
MKKFVAVLFLMLCSTLAWSADKPNPADFTIKVHITASHLKSECADVNCKNILYADSILNGKKIELSGVAIIVKKTLMLIIPGDYPARLIRDEHNSDSTLFNREYELLLPDNIVWQSFTTGISE